MSQEYDTDRLWQGAHEDAPRDEHGRPIHPDEDKNYPVCAQPKTDAVDRTKDGKRTDIPYCVRRSGWGTDRPTEAGGACKTHGGAGGAPEGWANGNARHLLFSKRMNDDDREHFRDLIDVGDGDKIPVDEFRATLSNIIAWEEMRFSRALDKHPDVEQIAMYECPECGESYRRSVDPDTVPTVQECDGTNQIDAKTFVPCDYTGPIDKVAGKEWVDFGDESVERKGAHIARLIKIYDQVSGPSRFEVDQDTTLHGDGDGAIDVNITSVGVDLADEEADGGDE
jgi:hypothetical protein